MPIEDAMKPFYTGWNTGDQLSQQDNARYTQFGNQALQNTGVQNREMLDHINALQKMYYTGEDHNGKPLPPTYLSAIGDFINQNQPYYTQGVYSVAPGAPQYQGTNGLAITPKPSFNIPSDFVGPKQQMATPVQQPPVSLPQMQQQQIIPQEMSPNYNEPLTTPQQLMQQQDAPAPAAVPVTKPVMPVKKRRTLLKPQNVMTNQGAKPITSWNPFM